MKPALGVQNVSNKFCPEKYQVSHMLRKHYPKFKIFVKQKSKLKTFILGNIGDKSFQVYNEKERYKKYNISVIKKTKVSRSRFKLTTVFEDK